MPTNTVQSARSPLTPLLVKPAYSGATAGVQFSDGSRWFGASGVTGPESASEGGRHLTVDDRFHIGSQTKTYTESGDS